jgi:DNA-binding MarR family transcriptional regulator
MPRVLPPDELGARLAEVFRVLGPLYRRTAQVVAADEAVEHVSTGARAVLEHLLVHGPSTVPAVARALELSRQFVQRSIDEARAADLVAMVATPRHRRSALATLTPAGRARIEQVQRRERAVLAGTPGDLTDADIDACLIVLRRLLQRVGRPLEAPVETAPAAV